MAWYDYIDSGTPSIFNPKVIPNAIDAERLEEKFQQAIRKFKPLYAGQVVSQPPVMQTTTKLIS